jgi:predicted metal-dependent HD superfamily phosphohydrolase
MSAPREGDTGGLDADSRRFGALWRRCVPSPPSPDADAVFAELVRSLRASNRHFHNLEHIRECVRRVDEVAPRLDDPDAVELALWFHDVIYTAGDPTNERRSAELFLRLATGAQPALRRRVSGLILATRHHGVPRTNDRRYVEDIDLVGFGAPWGKFMRNGDLLRLEFAQQADVEYYAGQVAFLARLARRPAFFATDYFRRRFEARAQENLSRLLALRVAEGYRPPP